MKRWGFNGHALSICVAVALLVGCETQTGPLVTSRQGISATGFSQSRAAFGDGTGMVGHELPASAFKVLYRFTNDLVGNQPRAPLYNYQGTLYGPEVKVMVSVV